MFPDMDNYTSIMTINPAEYGYINITALVGKNESKRVYRLKRTMEYRPTYSPLRDRMFASLTAVYSKIFELLESNKMNDGNLKNYYLVSIESANDIPRRILSFDMYLIQADNYPQLTQKPEFRNLPGIDDREKHIAVFAFGYQYEKNMNAIDITNKVIHSKAYKQIENTIKVYNFEEDSDLVFNTDDDKCKQFINNCFDGCDRYTYDIGLLLEDYEHDYTEREINENDSMIREEESESVEEQNADDDKSSEVEFDYDENSSDVMDV